MTEYDTVTVDEGVSEISKHPLAGVPQEVLDVARKILDYGVLAKDVYNERAHPMADGVVMRLRQMGYLKDFGDGRIFKPCDITDWHPAHYNEDRLQTTECWGVSDL